MAPFGMGLFISAMGLMEMKKPEEISEKFKDVRVLLAFFCSPTRADAGFSLTIVNC
jgi:hypothetical protein